MNRIKRTEGIAMSQQNITKFLSKFGIQANIVKEADMQQYQSLDDMFGSSDHIIIFVSVQGPTVGHWQVIFKDNNQLFFFDSYGFSPAKTLKMVQQDSGQTFGQSFNGLPLLIMQSEFYKTNNAFMNCVEYQEEQDNIETCGRYVCSVLVQKQKCNNDGQIFNLDVFYSIMKSMLMNSHLDNYDQLVSYMVK